MTLYKVRVGNNDGGVEEHDVHAENQQDAILIIGRLLGGACFHRILTVRPVPCECCGSMGTLWALSSDEWREAYWKEREKANALREDIRAYVRTKEKLREELDQLKASIGFRVYRTNQAEITRLKELNKKALQAIEQVERGE